MTMGHKCGKGCKHKQHLRTMPAEPKCERLEARGKPIGVDREAKVIRGYVVAQLGPFKSEGRGEFDEQSLSIIAELYKQYPLGIKSRFTHPNESGDGLGKLLGRSRGAYLSTCMNADGQEVACVRADLHLSASAFEVNPNGNLGEYILTLAEEDSDALSSSLVLSTKKEARRDEEGKPMLDGEGNELPPLWRPLKLFASDVVDTGDAVDGFLSVAKLSEKPRWTRDYLSRGESLLNDLFAGQSREVVEARCAGFLTRYLDRRYGGKKMAPDELAGDYIECPTCKGSGDCQNCGGTGISESGKGDCYRCGGTGKCDTCGGMGAVPLEEYQDADLAAGTVEEREDGFYAVFEDGTEEGPFATREEAEAAIAAKDAVPADEGASARPSVDLLRRRLAMKMKAG